MKTLLASVAALALAGVASQAAAQTLASVGLSGEVAQSCTVTPSAAAATVNLGATGTQGIGSVLYKCNHSAGFTRSITASNLVNPLGGFRTYKLEANEGAATGTGLGFTPVLNSTGVAGTINGNYQLVTGVSSGMSIALENDPIGPLNQQFAGIYSGTVQVSITGL